MTTPPDDTTADPHVVIATLRAERDAALAGKVLLARALAERTATLAIRNNEYGERIEQQAATIEVSQGDVGHCWRRAAGTGSDCTPCARTM